MLVYWQKCCFTNNDDATTDQPPPVENQQIFFDNTFREIQVADVEQVMITLARNIFWARNRRKMIQEELASVAKLPRSTISHLESGKGNPTLENLAKISEALGISIDELLTPRKHPVWGTSTFEPTAETYDKGKVRIFGLLPASLRSLNVKRFEIDPSGRLNGQQHPKLSREFVTMLSGELILRIDDEFPMTLRKGQSVQFRCDRPYNYENLSDETATAISATLLVTLL